MVIPATFRIKDTIDGDEVRFEREINELGIFKSDLGTVRVQIEKKPRGQGEIRNFSVVFDDGKKVDLAGFENHRVRIVKDSPRREELSAERRIKTKAQKEQVGRVARGVSRGLVSAFREGKETVSAGLSLIDGGSKPKRRTAGRAPKAVAEKLITTKAAKNRFLDAWFNANSRSFDSFFEDFGGDGAMMITALRDEKQDLYFKVLKAV